jgi:luciferase family oxidoreductase group 1
MGELLGYLDGSLPDDHAFRSLADTLPSGGEGVAPWLLGSSPDSAIWAGEMGLPYCFADFINPAGAGIVELYRRRFQPSVHAAEPYVMAACWTIAAEDEAAARRLAAPAAMMFAHLVRGELIAVPPVDEAIAWLAANPDPGHRRRRTIVGDVGQVHGQLNALADEYGADELMLVNILPDHAARVRSYELVAAEYGIAERAAAR